MADIHIDDFYRDVAKIFLRLYSIFPRKIILYVEDISGPDQPDEFGLHHPRFEACFSAMVWLAENGYVHFQDTIRQEALDQVVLTRKAFLLLASRSDLAAHPQEDALPPSLLEASLSNIAHVRAALKEGSSSAIKNCVSYLLSRPVI
ncbi:MAG: hypothetical protein R3E64_14930 [Halioglobus sp.]